MRSGQLTIALCAISCVLGIAACGSSGKSDSSAAGGHTFSLVGFANCMRSHGVPRFSDPGASGAGGSGGGGVSLVPAGVDTSSPAFKRASASCGLFAPGLGTRHPASAETTEQTLKFSKCMRAHGVTGFPDPSASPPPSLNGYSAVIRRGVYLAIPDTIDIASPAYKRAQAACRFGPAFS